MWEVNKRASWVVLGSFIVLGLGLLVAGVASPEGATTDDGTPLGPIYFVMAAIFILAPLVILGFVTLSNTRDRAFARAGIDARLLTPRSSGQRFTAPLIKTR